MRFTEWAFPPGTQTITEIKNVGSEHKTIFDSGIGMERFLSVPFRSAVDCLM